MWAKEMALALLQRIATKPVHLQSAFPANLQAHVLQGAERSSRSYQYFWRSM